MAVSDGRLDEARAAAARARAAVADVWEPIQEAAADSWRHSSTSGQARLNACSSAGPHNSSAHFMEAPDWRCSVWEPRSRSPSWRPGASRRLADGSSN
jgi:hypothetical protein